MEPNSRQQTTTSGNPEVKAGTRKTRDFTELGVYREVYPLVIESLKILGAVCGGVTHSAPLARPPSDHERAWAPSGRLRESAECLRAFDFPAVRPRTGAERTSLPLAVRSDAERPMDAGSDAGKSRTPVSDATQQQQQRKLEFVPEGLLPPLASEDNNDHSRISRQLLLESARTSVDILANLAEGYNAFHSRDKADCYRRARSCLCRSTCFLQVLGSLGVIDPEAATKISSGYSSLTGSFSGLIRSMEQGGNSDKNGGRRAAQQCFRT